MEKSKEETDKTKDSFLKRGLKAIWNNIKNGLERQRQYKQVYDTEFHKAKLQAIKKKAAKDAKQSTKTKGSSLASFEEARDFQPTENPFKL